MDFVLQKKHKALIFFILIMVVSILIFISFDDSIKQYVSEVLKSRNTFGAVWIIVICIVTTANLFSGTEKGVNKIIETFFVVGTHGLAITTSIKLLSVIFDQSMSNGDALPLFNELDVFTLLAMISVIVLWSASTLLQMAAGVFTGIATGGNDIEAVND